MTRRRSLRGGRLGHPARSGDSFTTSSEDRRLDEQGERDMSAAATRLPPGEGTLGGEVVGDEVPGRDRRAEARLARPARRAHLEHLAALPAEAEAHVDLRLLDRVSHAGAAAAQLRAVAQVERSEGRAALDPFALRGAVDGRPTAGDELLEALGALAPGDRMPAAERGAHLDRGAVDGRKLAPARAVARLDPGEQLHEVDPLDSREALHEMLRANRRIGLPGHLLADLPTLRLGTASGGQGEHDDERAFHGRQARASYRSRRGGSTIPGGRP